MMVARTISSDSPRLRKLLRAILKDGIFKLCGRPLIYVLFRTDTTFMELLLLSVPSIAYRCTTFTEIDLRHCISVMGMFNFPTRHLSCSGKSLCIHAESAGAGNALI